MVTARQRQDLVGSQWREPPRFAPAGRHTRSDIAARLRAIDWFANCGRSQPGDFAIPARLVRSWSDAVASLSDERWERTTLDATNALSEWLFTHAPTDYKHWNDRVDRFKSSVLAPLTPRVLVPVQQRHDLPDVFLHSVQWDLVNANSENEYIPSGHSVFFFLELIRVYEAGHLPCGWDGAWPTGSLIVF